MQQPYNDKDTPCWGGEHIVTRAEKAADQVGEGGGNSIRSRSHNPTAFYPTPGQGRRLITEYCIHAHCAHCAYMHNESTKNAACVSVDLSRETDEAYGAQMMSGNLQSHQYYTILIARSSFGNRLSSTATEVHVFLPFCLICFPSSPEQDPICFCPLSYLCLCEFVFLCICILLTRMYLEVGNI